LLYPFFLDCETIAVVSLLTQINFLYNAIREILTDFETQLLKKLSYVDLALLTRKQYMLIS
jgi:hypothetical protein